VLALLVVINGARADEPRQVRGWVVDETGRPVAGAAVGYFWRANGSATDRDGFLPLSWF
jgi:protocatechuate 3,4-dioxygenase beta subunit